VTSKPLHANKDGPLNAQCFAFVGGVDTIEACSTIKRSRNGPSCQIHRLSEQDWPGLLGLS